MSTDPTTPPPRGAKIFVNYRHEDSSGHTGRLYEWLCGRFGRDRVFRDINAIELGTDFVAAIENEIASCQVVLAVIGRQWLDSASGGRRLDNPNDYVRLELASALARNVRVIPVLVGGASMPREQDLPDDLKPLARRHAHELSESRWEFDVGRLIDNLEERLETRQEEVGARRRAEVSRGRFKLERYRQLVPARFLAALLVTTAALAVQAHYAFGPQLARVENVGEFSPAAKLGRHELTVRTPTTNHVEGLLLYHEGGADEIVDVGIDGAVLDGDTLMQLSNSNPPTTPAPIAYQTTKWTGRSTAAPCRTFVEIQLADKRAPPSSLSFYQLDAPGGADYRHLALKAEGARLLVKVITDAPGDDEEEQEGDDNEQAAGCQKLLRVGEDFAQPTAGTYSVGIITEPGAVLQFSFNPTGANNQLWDGAGGLFQPFDLGAEKVNPSDPPPFRASAVEVKPLGEQPADTPPLLSARSPEGGELLSVEALKVGPDSVRVNVSGMGFVRVDGRERIDLPARIKANPLPSLLLALCDAALFVWLMRLLFNRRRPSIR